RPTAQQRGASTWRGGGGARGCSRGHRHSSAFQGRPSHHHRGNENQLFPAGERRTHGGAVALAADWVVAVRGERGFARRRGTSGGHGNCHLHVFGREDGITRQWPEIKSHETASAGCPGDSGPQGVKVEVASNHGVSNR